MEQIQGNETLPSTETTEINNATTPEVTPQVEAAPIPGADAAAGATSAGTPSYTPNFTYKVYGKENTIDPIFHPLIKDADTEKKIRSLFTKANSFDPVFSEKQKIQEEYSGFKEKVEQRDRAIETVNGYLQKGDMHSFFQALKIPEDMVLKYALDRVQYRDMSPEQRAQVDAQYQQQHRAMTLEEQNQMLVQRVQQESARARTVELDTELSRPEVVSAANAFDARANQAGAFRQEIIDRGIFLWQTRQQDVPAKQVIQEVMARYGLNSIEPNINNNGANGFQFAGANQAPEQTKPKPVIPNIRGSGASPVRKVPRSIEDLKKLAAQKSAD